MCQGIFNVCIATAIAYSDEDIEILVAAPYLNALTITVCARSHHRRSSF